MTKYTKCSVAAFALVAVQAATASTAIGTPGDEFRSSHLGEPGISQVLDKANRPRSLDSLMVAESLGKAWQDSDGSRSFVHSTPKRQDFLKVGPIASPWVNLTAHDFGTDIATLALAAGPVSAGAALTSSLSAQGNSWSGSERGAATEVSDAGLGQTARSSSAQVFDMYAMVFAGLAIAGITARRRIGR